MQSGGRSCGDHAGNAIQGCRLAANRRITVDCVGIWQPVPYGKSSGTVQFLLSSCGFESLFQCQSQRLSSCFSNWGVLGRVVPKVWARVPGEFWKVPAVLGEVQESILGRVLWGSGQRFWQKVLRQRSGKKMRNEFGFQHTFPLLGTSPQVTLTCCRGSLFVRMTFAYSGVARPALLVLASQSRV